MSNPEGLSRVESFQYPKAHYGHLSDRQNAALQSFKASAATQGYYIPPSGNQKASHDDETMLRFLRARKFVPKDAFAQFKGTEDWRRKNKLDELYDTIDIEDYDESRRLYPQWTGRRDKRGIPIYVYQVSDLTAKRMASYESSIEKREKNKSRQSGQVSPKLLRLFALTENLIRFTLPLCSAIPNRPYPETPVSQSNNIVDISGVGLKQFWNLKAHMQDASELATAHYPETLDRIFIIGAPSFFPTVWGWIKRWFDPITVSKIFILANHNMKATLEHYIDRENIPRKYGGTLDWSWGSLPNLDPEIQSLLSWQTPTKIEYGNTFPTGPIKWEETSSGGMVALAVGTEKGRQRKLEVASYGAGRGRGPPTSSEPVNFGLPSTSGVHTHPAEDMEYFPTSGDTPPDEQDEPTLQGSRQPSLSSQRTVPAYDNVAVSGTPLDGSGAASTHAGSSLQSADTMAGTNPMKQTPSISYTNQKKSTDPASIFNQLLEADGVPRKVVDTTYATQPGQVDTAKDVARGMPATADSGRGYATTTISTQVADEMSHSTPSISNHNDGDTTRTINPSTVGQAPKELDVHPAHEDEPQTDNSYLGQAKALASTAYTNTVAVVGGVQQSVTSVIHGEGDGTTQPTKNADVPLSYDAERQTDNSYLGQAKALASTAYATTAAAVGAVEQTVMSAVHGSREEPPVQEEPEEARPKPEDPRVDSMDNRDVEEFIRSQYATHNNFGNKSGGQ